MVTRFLMKTAITFKLVMVWMLLSIAGCSTSQAPPAAVSAEGKTFHVPGCRFLHKHENENVRLIAASEAIREGYVPCVRCLRQYLSR